MPPRTSARSVSRDQAFSPPKQSNARSPQSPRRTRSSRSQSVELGDPSRSLISRGGKRAVRQVSVESTGSNASDTRKTSTGSGRRSRKNTRAVPARRDLSMVAEDRETRHAEVDMEDNEDFEIFDGSDQARHPESPSGSQFSGATAITTASNQEIEGLNASLIVESLPDLRSASLKMLKLLAPLNPTTDNVQKIFTEVRQIKSERARRLRSYEGRLRTILEDYLVYAKYIKPSIMLRKLLGSHELELDNENLRPDAIFQAANLAGFVRDIIVFPRDSQDMELFLQNLDKEFPQEAFLSGFDNQGRFGSSHLIDEAFELGLDIRTQTAIVSMRCHRGDSKNYPPKKLLAQAFYNSNSSDMEEIVSEGRLKSIGGMRADIIGLERFTDQETKMQRRFDSILNAFYVDDETASSGEYVDLDLLDEQFPWPTFLTNVVRWSRSRLAEIEQEIKEQGGIANIVSFFAQTLREGDSQIEINHDPPESFVKRRPLPMENITPAASGQSLFNGAGSVRALLNRGPVTKAMQKTKSKPITSQAQVVRNQPEMSARQFQRRKSLSETVHSQASDDFQPAMIDNAQDTPGGQATRPTKDYLRFWNEYDREMSKENRSPVRVPVAKKRFIDIQPDAKKVDFDDSSQDSRQDNRPGLSSRKRSHQERDLTEESEDQGFEIDARIPNQSRRTAGSANQRRAIVRSPQPAPKRIRLKNESEDREDDSEEISLQRSQELEQGALQAIARDEDDEDDEDEDEDEGDEAITFSQVSAAARIDYTKAKSRASSNKPQRRTPWSEKDTNRLEHLIVKFGCSWSLIQKQGGFEKARNQTALKDKARNMKVAYLRGGMRLPRNFENIALGKKELECVRAVWPYQGD
ncbi:hypothetical protein B7494_g6462 [Chlorociboria aeruginascens]|nr:hypothetical protein B7494_g6462 [Chlorociboria aeruginascens]